MTRDRDEKRLVRAKAERERTSYAEARRRFDRSGGVGGAGKPNEPLPGGGAGPSPISTTPLLTSFKHPVGFEVGLISVANAAGLVALRWSSTLSSSIRGPLVVPRLDVAETTRQLARGGGGGIGEWWFDFRPEISSDLDAALNAGTVQLTVEVVDQEGDPWSDPDQSTMTVVLQRGPDDPVLVGYENVWSGDYEIHAHFRAFNQARAADRLLPVALVPMSAEIVGPDHPPHHITSIEHWPTSSVLNTFHPAFPDRARRLPMSWFAAIDDKGRHYESMSDGATVSTGIGLRERHRVIPRLADNSRWLRLFERTDDGLVADPLGRVDLRR